MIEGRRNSKLERNLTLKYFKYSWTSEILMTSRVSFALGALLDLLPFRVLTSWSEDMNMATTKKKKVDPNNQAGFPSNQDEYGYLFETFCNSSTVHGTFFWNESTTSIGKSVWILIVLLGILYLIDWERNF